MDFLSYLLSDSFCFTVILHMSSNKTKFFSLQNLPSYSISKKEFTVLHHSTRKRTQRGILQSPTFSKETIYLSSHNDKPTFIFSAPFFSLSFCPPLSLYSLYLLPSFCQALHIQSNFLAVCVFHASLFLGQCLKMLGCIFPLGDLPKIFLCSAFWGQFCASHPQEQHKSAFDSNTYPDLQLSCRLRQYWEINSSFSVFCAQILMFTKIKDDKAEGRNLCRTSIDAAGGSGARYGLISAKLQTPISQ